MVDEVQVEHRDPQAITTRSYTTKSTFTYKDRTYYPQEAIALDDEAAQPLIEQGLLVNPDGDLPPEDQVAPASEPVAEAPPAEEEPPAKESRRRKPADSE